MRNQLRLRLLLVALLSGACLDAMAIEGNPHEVAGTHHQRAVDSFFGGVSIDTFAGGLTIQHPLFEYPNNGKLGMSMTATYNSKQVWRWDDKETVDTSDDEWYLSSDGWLGPGWSLHLGRVALLTTKGESEKQPHYIAPSGAARRLYPMVNGAVSDFITRDGTYIRAWEFPDGSGWRIFMPTGAMIDLRHQSTATGENRSGWYATKHVDLHGNALRIAYHEAPHDHALQTLEDDHGRFIQFLLYPDVFVDPALRGRLRSIYYPTFGGYTSGIHFDYTVETISEPGNPLDATGTPATLTTAQLTQIRMPEGKVIRHEYNAHGELNALVHATGARAEFDHSNYTYTAFHQLPWYKPQPGFTNVVLGRNVREHRLYTNGDPSDDSPENFARWTFDRSQFICAGTPQSFRVSSEDPVGTVTEYTFHSFDRDVYVPSVPLLVDSIVWDSDPARDICGEVTSNALPVRVERLKWELDDFGQGVDENPRVVQRWTGYPENGTWKSADACKWNGVGAFELEVFRGTPDGPEPVLTVPHIAQHETESIYCQWVLGLDAELERSMGSEAVLVERRYDIDGRLIRELRHAEFRDPSVVASACDMSLSPDVTVTSAGRIHEETVLSLSGNRPYTGPLHDGLAPPVQGGCTVPSQLASPLTPDGSDVLREFDHYGDLGTGTGYDAHGHAAHGNVRSITVTGGDTVDTLTTELSWHAGVTHEERIVGLSWAVADLDIDAPSGFVARSRDPSGFAVDYDYDELGRRTLVRPGPTATGQLREFETRIVYSLDSRTVDEVRGPATGPPEASMENYFTYDGIGNLIRRDRRLPDGTLATREWEHDPTGRLAFQGVWRSEGHLEPRQPLASSDIGHHFSYEYTRFDGTTTTDCLGRLRRVTYPGGSVREFEYSGLNWSESLAGTNNDPTMVARTDYYQDAFERLYRVTTSAGLANGAFTHDVNGNVTRAEIGEAELQVRERTYDAIGRLRSSTDPELGRVTFDVYDAGGRLRGYTLASGRAFRIERDVLGRKTQFVRTAPGAPALLEEHFYDETDHGEYATGKRTGSWASNGPEMDFYYDGLSGRTSRVEFALDGLNLSSTATYTGLGLIESECNPAASGESRCYRREYSHGLVVRLEASWLGRDVVADAAYHPDGGLRMAMLGNGTWVAIGRDASGRVDNVSSGSDVLGIFLDSGTLRYDAAGYLTAAGMPGELTAPNVAYDYSHDLAGRLTRVSLSGGQERTFDYIRDPFGNLLSLAHEDGSGDPCGSFGGSLEFSGREYRGLDDGAVGGSVTNRVSALGLTCDPVAVAEYDADGNLRRDQWGTYLYDDLGRLVQASPFSGTGFSQRFDADGSLVARRSDDGVEELLVPGWSGRLASRFEGVGGALPTLQHDVVHLGEQAIATVSAGGAISWRHTDHLGSLRAVTDDSGALVGGGLVTYGPYGNKLPGSVALGIEDCFAGHPVIEGAPIVPMGRRTYSPGHGSFMQPDPARADQEPRRPMDWNLYLYAQGDPTAQVDPTGYASKAWHFHTTFMSYSQAGYSFAYALHVATANVNTDRMWRTSATNPFNFWARKHLHSFGKHTPERFEELITRAAVAVGSGSAEEGPLGHAVQDWFTHQGYGVLFGHAFHGKKPDKDPTRLARAKIWTDMLTSDPEGAVRFANELLAIALDDGNVLQAWARWMTGLDEPYVYSAAEHQKFLARFGVREVDVGTYFDLFRNLESSHPVINGVGFIPWPETAGFDFF